MKYKSAIRYAASIGTLLGAIGIATLPALAQEKPEGNLPAASQKTGARDPFRKYQPVIKPTKASASKLEPPSLQVRIDRYRAQKMAAANAHVAAPKPTT